MQILIALLAYLRYNYLQTNKGKSMKNKFSREILWRALGDWAALLEKLPKGSWDYRVFRNEEKTAACAVGWATAIPFIAENGWQLSKKFNYSVYDSKTRNFGNPAVLASRLFYLTDAGTWGDVFFRSHQGFTAADKAQQLRKIQKSYA